MIVFDLRTLLEFGHQVLNLLKMSSTSSSDDECEPVSDKELFSRDATAYLITAYRPLIKPTKEYCQREGFIFKCNQDPKDFCSAIYNCKLKDPTSFSQVSLEELGLLPTMRNDTLGHWNLDNTFDNWMQDFDILIRLANEVGDHEMEHSLKELFNHLLVRFVKTFENDR